MTNVKQRLLNVYLCIASLTIAGLTPDRALSDPEPSISRSSLTAVLRHKPIYSLLYDGEPTLCRPLLAVYNKALSKLWSTILRKANRRPPFAGSVTRRITDFELTDLAAFTAAGFEQPTLLGEVDSVPYYDANIFNDGHSYTLVLLPSTLGTMPYTVADILRPGADWPQPERELFNPVSASIQMSANLLSIYEGDPPNRYYVLRHLPHLAADLHNMLRRGYPGPTPFLAAQSATVQVLIYRGQTFLIANTATILPQGRIVAQPELARGRLHHDTSRHYRSLLSGALYLPLRPLSLDINQTTRHVCTPTLLLPP